MLVSSTYDKANLSYQAKDGSPCCVDTLSFLLGKEILAYQMKDGSLCMTSADMVNPTLDKINLVYQMIDCFLCRVDNLSFTHNKIKKTAITCGHGC